MKHSPENVKNWVEVPGCPGLFTGTTGKETAWGTRCHWIKFNELIAEMPYSFYSQKRNGECLRRRQAFYKKMSACITQEEFANILQEEL